MSSMVPSLLSPHEGHVIRLCLFPMLLTCSCWTNARHSPGCYSVGALLLSCLEGVHRHKLHQVALQTSTRLVKARAEWAGGQTAGRCQAYADASVCSMVAEARLCLLCMRS